MNNQQKNNNEWSEEAIITKLGGPRNAKTAMDLAFAMAEAGIFDHITFDSVVKSTNREEPKK